MLCKFIVASRILTFYSILLYDTAAEDKLALVKDGTLTAGYGAHGRIKGDGKDAVFIEGRKRCAYLFRVVARLDGATDFLCRHFTRNKRDLADATA